MKKNGRTIKEDFLIVKRGIKEFDKILPKQMMWITGKCIVTSITPYIAVVMSAFILNELAGKQDKKVLLAFALISVGFTLLVSGIGHYLEAKISVGYRRLFSSHEIWLTDKAYRLPYYLLEEEKTRSLRDQVSGSLNISGGGMASLYWDIDVVVTNFCSAGISFVLCTCFVFQVAERTNISETIGMIAVLIVLIAGCSYWSCKIAGKRFDAGFELFEHAAAYQRYGDFYTMNYIQDEDMAMDIRIFHQKNLVLEKSQQDCYQLFARGKRKEMRAVNRCDWIKALCTGICGMTVYAIVGYLAIRGAIGIGNVAMMYSAVTMFIGALSELAQIITDLRNNNTHLLHYFAYMDLDEEEQIGELPFDDSKYCDILFEHVSFHYPESDVMVLQDVNLRIAHGEKVAIIGENGSGKTTLIKLLCRLYRPVSGRILLGGQDIWEYSYENYMKKIATVFQDFSLFAFSLAENVAASAEYDTQRVYEIFCQVGLQKKIDHLEKGIEQAVFHDYEENGTDLSGGEAQKVAISRAIYKAAPIIILDEPTAALDPYAEREIYEQFFKNLTKETMLLISHRLSSCRFCDKIVVLDSGQLVQQGTHEELLCQANGKYIELWEMQAQYYT